MIFEDVNVGMRVSYDEPGERKDAGVVSHIGVRPGYFCDNEKSIWVKWDSDGAELFTEAQFLEPEAIVGSYNRNDLLSRFYEGEEASNIIQEADETIKFLQEELAELKEAFAETFRSNYAVEKALDGVGYTGTYAECIEQMKEALEMLHDIVQNGGWTLNTTLSNPFVGKQVVVSVELYDGSIDEDFSNMLDWKNVKRYRVVK